MENIFEGIEIADDIKQELTERIGTELSEKDKMATINANRILDSVAADLEKESGVVRLANETKITDYYKRAFKELKENSINEHQKILSEKDVKIEELEKQIESGITDDQFKSEYETLKKSYGELSDILEAEKGKISQIEEDYNNKLNAYRIDSHIDKSMPEIDKDSNKWEVEGLRKQAIKEIKEDFNFKFTNENEIVLENKETFSTSAKLDELLKEKMQNVLPKEQQYHESGKPPINNKTLNFTSDMKQNAELIESHLLATKFKSRIDKGYSQEFEKLMKEAREATK